MASTRGFQVSVLPQAASVDPRLLAFSPQAITQGYEQGLRSASNLMQIQQAREEAPIRQQLLQLQADNAMLNNARLAQPISRVIGTEIEAVDRFPEEVVTLEDGTTRTERPAGYDLFQIDTIEEFDPRTGQVATRRAPTRLVNTLEQLEANQSLINSRNNPRPTASNATALERNIAAYEAAKAAGDEETANLYLQNIQRLPRPTKADQIASTWAEIARLEELGDANSMSIAQSLRMSLPQERITPYTSIGARAGFTQEVASALSKIPAGAELLARANGQIQLTGRFVPTPQDTALIQSVEAQLTASPEPAPRQSSQFQIQEVATTPAMPSFLSGTQPQTSSAESVPEFATVADAEAAGAAGRLGNKRVRIKIGNRYAWWEPNS